MHAHSVYDAPSNTLRHQRTIHDPAFVSINDIVAVSATAFFATNDRYFRNSIAQRIEQMSLIAIGNLVCTGVPDTVLEV